MAAHPQSSPPAETECLAEASPRFKRVADKDSQVIPQHLARLQWVQELTAQPNVDRVMTAGAMLDGSSELPKDHMMTALLSVGLIRDTACLYDSSARRFYTLIVLGANVCGHRGICHGGLTAMIIDETLGGLSYMLKRDGILGQGPAFTAHLEVDYKKPIPAESTMVCMAELDFIEGRKAWVKATVLDRPDGTVLATGKALFVIARTAPPELAAVQAPQQP